MSVFDTDILEPVIICRKCGVTRLCFDDSQRGHNGNLIPLEFESKQVHKCDISDPFPCIHCDSPIYLDRKILSPTGRRIPLNLETGEYHLCTKKQRTAEELHFFNKRSIQ